MQPGQAKRVGGRARVLAIGFGDYPFCPHSFNVKPDVTAADVVHVISVASATEVNATSECPLGFGQP